MQYGVKKIGNGLCTSHYYGSEQERDSEFSRYVAGGVDHLLRKIERDPTATIAERVVMREEPKRRILMVRLSVWSDWGCDGRHKVYVFKDGSRLCSEYCQ